MSNPLHSVMLNLFQHAILHQRYRRWHLGPRNAFGVTKEAGSECSGPPDHVLNLSIGYGP